MSELTIDLVVPALTLLAAVLLWAVITASVNVALDISYVVYSVVGVLQLFYVGCIWRKYDSNNGKAKCDHHIQTNVL